MEEILRSQPPGSIRHVDGKELKEESKRIESVTINARLREGFESNIKTFVSVLNANNLDRETIALVNDAIRQHIQAYHNSKLIIKEI